MSNINIDSTKGSHSNKQKEKNEKLWEKLKIDFKLQSTKFSDDRIIGSINIEPDEALRLIKHFFLVTNDSSRFQVDCDCRKISVTVFDSTKEKLSVYIEVISIYDYLSPKSSMKQDFPISPQRFPLTSIVSCEWSSKNSKPSLIVRWFHMGDKMVHIYILCLDKKEMQYIHKPKHGVYQVCINNFQPGTRHTIQILARLNNGQETYRSEPKNIVVPDKIFQGQTEVIDISEESEEPADNQDLIDEDEKNQERENHSLKTTNQPSNKSLEYTQGRKSQIESRQTNEKTNTLLSCGCQEPHEKFLGVDHYFKMTRKKPSSYIQSKPFIQNRRNTSSVEENTDDNTENQEEEENGKESDKDIDDDKDVVYQTVFN